MRVLGIEGTAWAASAAVYDAGTGDVRIHTDAYRPESGGIHPREAAEHMREAIPDVIAAALDDAAAMADDAADAGGDATATADDATASTDDASGDGGGGADAGGERPPVDAVAFSRGPGLGPCLRVVGTAARSLSMTLDVPLVGVNHMVAHLEIGRHESGFESPVCINASGANAHVLAYRNGRYRVLGETMDTGVGNAIDKFTRHVGWGHPGGPKVEAAAKDGEYVELPYVVKGMDFSFSGIMSAAKEAYDDGVPVEDVCFSLQENVFGMLAEVSERALSLTGADELVLGGGVGQNDRLTEMLREMCEARGAEFYAPEPRFLRDNAGMIAVLGAKMYEAGDTLAVEDSRVDPDFRPDEVPVTWRARSERSEDRDLRERRPASGEAASEGAASGEADNPVGRRWRDEREVEGAEATVELGDETVVKRRLPKPYRHPDLDRRLRRHRTVEEARLTSDARRAGVPTPVVLDVDLAEHAIEFQRVGDRDLRDLVRDDTDAAVVRVRAVGRHLAACHDAGFVHGDPTTRNVRTDGDRTFLIDFGLGYYTDDREDYAMDLHVFAQSVQGTAADPDRLLAVFEDAYEEVGDAGVLSQLREIEGRGRYQGG